MFLLTDPYVKNSHIKATIYFIFLKNLQTHIWKSFNTKFNLSKRMEKAVINQSKFWHLFKTQLRGKSKKISPETIVYKISETNSSFHLKKRTTGKVLFDFFKFCFAGISKILILEERLGTSRKLRILSDIS